MKKGYIVLETTEQDTMAYDMVFSPKEAEDFLTKTFVLSHMSLNDANRIGKKITKEHVFEMMRNEKFIGSFSFSGVYAHSTYLQPAKTWKIIEINLKNGKVTTYIKGL